MPLFDFDLGADTGNFSTKFGDDLTYTRKSENLQDNSDTSQENNNDPSPSKNKKPVDVANIISASALGLNSLTNAFSIFAGKPALSQNDDVTYQQREEEEPKKKTPSPLLIVGVIGAAFLLIGLLVYAKKKTAAAIPPPTT